MRQAPGDEARQAVAATPDGPPPARWTLKAVRATFPWLRDYDLSGVWRLLQRCDLCLRRAQVRQFSPDPDYLTTEARLLASLKEAATCPEEVALVFLDEMGDYRWGDAAEVWWEQAPAPRPETERAGPNNQQWRLIGALNACSGRVDDLDTYMVGRRQVIQFHAPLDKASCEVARLYVVQDNWSIHSHPDVLEALQKLPRLVPVWLPTDAPWLNPREKLWRWLRTDQLYMHRLAHDWKTLRVRVNAFLDQFASDSPALLRYVGVLGEGKLARALRAA